MMKLSHGQELVQCVRALLSLASGKRETGEFDLYRLPKASVLFLPVLKPKLFSNILRHKSLVLSETNRRLKEEVNNASKGSQFTGRIRTQSSLLYYDQTRSTLTWNGACFHSTTDYIAIACNSTIWKTQWSENNMFAHRWIRRTETTESLGLGLVKINEELWFIWPMNVVARERNLCLGGKRYSRGQHTAIIVTHQACDWVQVWEEIDPVRWTGSWHERLAWTESMYLDKISQKTSIECFIKSCGRNEDQS